MKSLVLVHQYGNLLITLVCQRGTKLNGFSIKLLASEIALGNTRLTRSQSNFEASCVRRIVLGNVSSLRIDFYKGKEISW